MGEEKLLLQDTSNIHFLCAMLLTSVGIHLWHDSGIWHLVIVP